MQTDASDKSASPPVGLLVVDKPIGPSSMDVVRVVRRACGVKKVGHAGTLDPLASGVVVCLVGRAATRLCDRLMAQPKVYQTTIDLAAFTDTDDAEAPPQPVAVDAPPDAAQVDRALGQFVGTIEQTPPAYSAVHVNGQRAYRLARKGERVDLPARIVRIEAIDRLAYDWPLLQLRITCGKGVYIRSLARQIGQALDTGGHLRALRRLAVGQFTVDQAVHLDRINRLGQADLIDLADLPLDIVAR